MIALLGTSLAGMPAVALDSGRSITQFSHTGWTVRNGMPGNVYVLAQTPDGYLWLGGLSGLSRFDGVRVEPFDHRFPGIGINALTVATSGELWIGSDAGVARLSHDVLTSFNVPDFPLSTGVRLLAPGLNGDVWVASDSQVAHFDGQNWRVMQSDWGTSDAYRRPGGIWALAVARDGAVWAKNALNVYYLRPGATRFVKAEGYGTGVMNFARAPDGRLWTADFASKHFYALPDLGHSGPAFPAAQIGAPVPPGLLGWASFDREGTLWCANSVTGGLFRVRTVTGANSQAESFHTSDGLTSEVAGAGILEDREGDIWLGTAAGLDRFAPANIVIEDAIPRFQRNADITASATAVYVADGWGVPGGHAAEQFYRIADGAPQTLPNSIGDHVSFVAQGVDSLWVGSGERLVQFQGGVQSVVPLPPEAQGARLESVAQNGDDLWMAIDGRGVFRRRNDQWTHFDVPGIDIQTSMRIRSDSMGGVWFIRSGAEPIIRLQNDRPDIYKAGSGPNIGEIYAIVPEPHSVLLTGQLGVSRFDGRRFHTLSVQQAPFLTVTTGVVADDVGGTWFQTLKGIYRVATGQLEQAFLDPRIRLDGQLFDIRDGLTSSANLTQRGGGTAVRGPDGRLWFLTADNVFWIDPHHLYRNTVPPPVRIRSLSTHGLLYDTASAPRLEAGTADLEIDYTALSLQNPERVRFRYQLEGVDKTWIDAGPRRQAFYTRLVPGHYHFHVTAANNDQIWNPTGATFDFTIPPTFVQSTWFLVLCAFLAVVTLWLAYTTRLRQVKVSIQGRFEERIAERVRIARDLHDTLLQGFPGVILRFQTIMEGLPADQPAKAEMNAALERADEVLISGRDRVQQLRTLDPGDLSDAFAVTARVLSASSDARFRIACDGEPRALHPIVSEELTAIGEEAITNAFRHASARNIDVVLTYGLSTLTLCIVDDGAGIAAEVLALGGRAGHFGLTGMRERAEKIKAKLSISSWPAAGAEILVTVPAHVAYASSAGQLRLWRELRRAIAW